MMQKILLLLLLLTLVIEFRLFVLSTSSTLSPSSSSSLSNSVSISYDGEHSSISSSSSVGNTDQLKLDLNVDPGPLKTINEQDRIDTIVRAFQRLPSAEREKLGVDLSKSIEAGSSLAKELQKAWDIRQQEVKEAMESVLKPAEFMAQLASVLRGNTTSIVENEKEEEISRALIELESLVSDIDNARDFHSIGGWPILVSMLGTDKPINHRMYAAWTIGTAIKNSYDYQLWTLEKGEDNGSNQSIDKPNCLQALVHMLGSEYHDDSQQLQRRALYAISSAIRGNVDIQNALMDDFGKVDTSFLTYMETIVSSNTSHPELVRKAWALVGDMLDERSYVRQELSSELPENMKEQVDQMKLLGDHFCSLSWTVLASNAIRKLIGDSTSSSYIDLHSNPPSLTSVPLRATISSLITVLQQIQNQTIESCDQPDTKGGSTIKFIIEDQLKQIMNLKGDSNGEVRMKADEVLTSFSSVLCDGNTREK